MTVSKALPQSIEAEEGLLGSLIIDPETIAQIADVLSPDDFYRDAHRTLYEVMCWLYERRRPADFITLCDELERRNQLEHIGGAGYITSLVNQVPTSGNADYYAHIIAQKALYRRLIHAAGQIASVAYQEETDALETAERLIFALGQQRAPSEITRIDTILSDCMMELDALHTRRAEIIGVPTGFRPLDVPLGGLQRSDLIILAARPGTGKTSFALNVARNAAHHQKRVLIFSLEMSKKQLGTRLLAMETPIDQQRLRLGWVHDEEWEHLIAAMGSLAEGHIWIDDTAGLSLTALRSRARRLQAQHGVDLVIVDYLQLMHAALEGKRYPNREQEIAEISRGLKGIAKELEVPVLALAQLSRAVESRQSKVPQLSDLRESGSIENDADIVCFIYREELYDPDNVEAQGTADIIIAKHRNGPVGTVRLGFEPAYTRFHTLTVTPGETDERG